MFRSYYGLSFNPFDKQNAREKDRFCHSSNYLEPFSSVYLDVLSGSDSVLVRLNGGYSA